MSKRGYGEGQLAPYRHLDHPRPVTRRQFLAQGFISGAAWIAAPSLLGLFKTQEAKAQAISCGLGAAGGMLPFLVFDLGGGASIAGGNVLVGVNNQTEMLGAAAYTKMGMAPGATPLADPNVVSDLVDGAPLTGLAFHRDSALLRGMRLRAPTALANTNGAIFCARSDNDTGNNPHNPIYGIYSAGAEGALLDLVGSENSDSGGNSTVPMSMFDPSVRPTRVSQPSEARGLVDTGQLVTLLDDPADAAAVMAAAESISNAKVARITETNLVKSLINCAYQEARELIGQFGDPNQLDPTQDALINQILTPADFTRSEFRKTASIMKLVLGGFAGAGTIEFGGYDYHDGTRATGERKDEIAGEAIGAALEYAALRNQPLVIYLISDGSVSSDGVLDNSADGAGKGVWRGDSSDTSSTVMLVYSPAGRPEMTGVGNQVGRYRSNGSVETSGNPIGDNVTALAETAVLNYLALHNQVGSLGAVLPGNSIGGSVGQLTAFAPLPGF